MRRQGPHASLVLVAGPGAIPVILGPQEAGKGPELAVLSAMAHGRTAGLAPALMEAVVTSARGLDEERFRFYVDLTLSAMGRSARSALEAMMQSGNYQYQSELVRKLVAQGRQEGRQEGRQQGRQQGRQEGQQEGRLEGERIAILDVLDARGLVVSDAARKKVMACTELEQLKGWLRGAATARSVQELFKRTPTSKPTARTAGKQRRGMKTLKPRPRP